MVLDAGTFPQRPPRSSCIEIPRLQNPEDRRVGTPRLSQPSGTAIGPVPGRAQNAVVPGLLPAAQELYRRQGICGEW